MSFLKILIFSKLSDPSKNFLRRLRYWVIRFFTIPMHLGSTDYYPPVNYLGSYEPFRRRWSFAPKNRLNFWTKIAKSYPNFRHFYSEDPCKSFASSDEFKKLRAYRNPILDLYSNGVGKIENFLDFNEHKTILKQVEEKIIPQYQNQNNFSEIRFAEIRIEDMDVNRMIYQKTKIFEEIIFGKNFGDRKYQISSFSVENSSSPASKASGANPWHQDRFIPAFKLLYFPTGVKTSPFEYMKGSHKIDDQYLKNAFLTSSQKCNDIVDLNFENYEKESFYVKENTLVLAATHGLHRRLGEKKPGIRNSITISFYFLFTRHDLYWNFIKKSFLHFTVK